jgi:hypothetical protein
MKSCNQDVNEIIKDDDRSAGSYDIDITNEIIKSQVNTPFLFPYDILKNRRIGRLSS